MIIVHYSLWVKCTQLCPLNWWLTSSCEYKKVITDILGKLHFLFSIDNENTGENTYNLSWSSSLNLKKIRVCERNETSKKPYESKEILTKPLLQNNKNADTTFLHNDISVEETLCLLHIPQMWADYCLLSQRHQFNYCNLVQHPNDPALCKFHRIQCHLQVPITVSAIIMQKQCKIPSSYVAFEYG